MKRNANQSRLMIGMTLLLATTLVSCSQDAELDNQAGNKKGQLTLTLGSNADFLAETRAVDESSYENTDNYDVVVTDKDGNEKLSCKGSQIASKMPLTMVIGGFTVRASYGEESAASRDQFFVLGEYSGTIKSDETESIEVLCTPTCGKITVNFDESMPTYFADYNVVFTGTEALGNNTISWLKDDTEPWYVKLKSGAVGETIDFTITTTTKDEFINSEKEQISTMTGTFKLSRNKAYKMNIKPTYTSTSTGDLSIEVEIDETTNDIPVDIDVPVTWL